MTRFTVTADCEIVVHVHNPDAIERVTGPAGDEWRAQFYALHTVDDVISHWTYNVLCDAVRDVSRLEGWADIDADAVTVSVEFEGSRIEAQA